MRVCLEPRPPPRSKLGVYDPGLQQVSPARMPRSHLGRERRRDDAGIATASTLAITLEGFRVDMYFSFEVHLGSDELQ